MRTKTTFVVLASVLLVLGITGVALSATLDTSQADASVTVNTYVDITLSDINSDGVNFPNVDPGDSVVEESQNSTDGAVTITVENTTNTDVNISTSGTNFDEGTDTIAIGQATESTNSTKADGRSMSSTTTELVSNVGGGGTAESQDIWYWLDVPDEYLTAGTYNSTFTYDAQPA